MSYTNRTFSVAKRSFDKYSLVYLTWSRYENDWPSTIHFHSFTEFIFVANGEGELLTENDSHKLVEGDIAIICPNTPHTETSQTKNCLEYYIFAIENLTFDIITDSDSDLRNDVLVYNIDNMEGRKLLLALFKRAEAELANQKMYYEVYVQSLINEALIYILRKTHVKDIQITDNSVPNECSFVKRYIDIHFGEKLSLNEIAKKSYFSKFYLIHSFKNHYGVTPYQYLLDKRLSEAATLLSSTNLSVTNVTISVGFSSASQLAKAFKEKYGCTPQHYRTQIQINATK